MSRENVELLRRSAEHFERTGEPLWETMDPEIEIHDHDLPNAGPYRGHDGWRAWMANFAEAWESFAAAPEEYIDAGDDKVVVVLRVSARGKASGASVERLDGLVWTVRGGKTVRLDYYNSRAQALEAAGLRE
jgi:uncharacterized protein